MEGLKKMDKEAFVSQMQRECRRIMEQVADAVNNAPTGNLISGSEMQVRDLMAELRQKVFETAVQMRVDATDQAVAFFPCSQRVGQNVPEQGASQAECADGQRTNQLRSPPLVHRCSGK